ncbi:MAG: ATP-binding cassette domain-containing protein, partial [Spirochaetales bacterium]|nr:ATP-binding cassette domain-containing protein [Spirochaetales bacterium]
MSQDVLLDIKDLAVEFLAHSSRIQALRGIDLTLLPGQFHALVGESGAGKTVTACTVLRLLPESARIVRGSVVFQDHNLLSMSGDVLRNLRGREISMIFQQPSKYLNPSMKASQQIMESLRYHLGYSDSAAYGAARELFEKVGLPARREDMARYPHEFSGGMRQRLMIAMAVACTPSLLIADEPTTALDVGTQLQIINLLQDIRRASGMAILYVTHNIGIVKYAADYISIIYAGKIIESAPRELLFSEPMHPYTRLLLASAPGRDKRGTRLRGVPGSVPRPDDIPAGCAFHPRCPIAQKECQETPPPFVRLKTPHRCACFYPGRMGEEFFTGAEPARPKTISAQTSAAQTMQTTQTAQTISTAFPGNQGQAGPVDAELPRGQGDATREGAGLRPPVLLRVENISKTFAGSGILRRSPVAALNGVSFSIEEGDIFGLVGESGAGKTTLARIILFLEHPSAGEIFFKNTRLSSL